MPKKGRSAHWIKLAAADSAAHRRATHELAKDTTAQANLFVVLLATFGVCALATLFSAAVLMGEFDDAPFGRWGISVLVIPLDLLGLITIYNLFHQIALAIRRRLGGVGVGKTNIQLSKHPLRPGDTCQARISQGGDLTLRALRVVLVCDMKEPEPTDKLNALPNPSKRIYERELATKPAVRVTPERPYEFTCELAIPRDGVSSQDPNYVDDDVDYDDDDESPFGECEDHRSAGEASGQANSEVLNANENESPTPADPYAGQEITWKLLVRGDIAGWPDFERVFRLVVETSI